MAQQQVSRRYPEQQVQQDGENILTATVEFNDPENKNSGKWTFSFGSHYSGLTLEVSSEFHQDSKMHKELLLNTIVSIFFIARYSRKADIESYMRLSIPFNKFKTYLGGFHDILINGVKRSYIRLWNNGYPISYRSNGLDFDVCIITDLNQLTSVPRFMFPGRR